MDKPAAIPVDYALFDAPKHFMDFKNLSNFEDDDADQWFDNHTEEGFEDAFLPGLDTSQFAKSVKTEPDSKELASEPSEQPSTEIVTPEVKVEDTEQASSGGQVRDELQQIERNKDPENRETIVISKAANNRPFGPGRYSPRPQPIQKPTTQPSVKKENIEPVAKNDSVESAVENEPVEEAAKNATVESVAKNHTNEPELKQEVSPPKVSPKMAKSSKKAVPVIKQAVFKAQAKPRRSAAQKAVSSIHSILSPKKRTPRKASLPDGTQGADTVKEKKPGPLLSKKTYEQLQLEEVKRLQNETRKRLRANRKSFAKLSKTSGPVQVKGAMPSTEPVEFKFHKTTREKKGLVMKGHSVGGVAPQSFINSLRSSQKADNYNPNMSTSTKPPTPPGGTKVKPFKFHLDDRLKIKPDPPQSSTTDKPFVPMAEYVEKFQKATPPRFRRTAAVKKAANENSKDVGDVLPLTIPVTPQLSTKTRSRPVTVKSAAAEEEEELERIKQQPFKARPLNPAVFEREGMLGVPLKIIQRRQKAPQSPELATKKRCEERREKEGDRSEQGERDFHAKPMPDFSKVKGLPVKRNLPLTNPKSPVLCLKRRRLHEDDEDSSPKKARTDQDDYYQFKAQPLPDFQHVFKPQLEERPTTRPEPFTFEERDKDKPTRESFVEMILRKERPAPFKAQRIPDFSADPGVPAKKDTAFTVPEPFSLQSNVRAQVYATKWQEKMDKEESDAKAAVQFKAKDASVLYERPFITHPSHKPLTNPEDFVLSTENRSFQRATFDAKLQQDAQRREEDNLQRRALRELQEKKEMAKYRKSLVHKAQPVKHYSGVAIHSSDKPLTQPVSPHFYTDSRLR